MEIKTILEQIKSPLYRTFEIKKEAINVENRTVELSFSSEEPYQRWFGNEILGHDAKEIDMKFISSGSAPFLDGHDTGKQIGVIEKAWIKDKKGRATVRFSKSKAADEVFQDIVDGIRKNVSVGYDVKSMVLVSEKKDEKTYRVNKWQPLETSSVAIPADMTVGIGKKQKITTEVVMDGSKEVDTAKIEQETRDREISRIAEITALGDFRDGKFREEATAAIKNGWNADKLRALIMEKMSEEKAEVNLDPKIGMGENEKKRFSFLRLVRAMASGDWREAEFERECSQAFEDKIGRRAKGCFVPPDMLEGGAYLDERHVRSLTRDLNVGTGSEGGYTVAEQLLSSSFIDLLANQANVMAAGARILDNLVGDIDIPKQTGGATAYWVSSGSDIPESQPAFGQIRMNPKTVGCLTDLTRRFILQTSLSAEAFVRMDFARSMALRIDSAALNGTGASGEPLGILGTAGIGSVTFGVANTPSWGEIVDLETEINIDNALAGSLAYMTTPAITGNMKQTTKDVGSGLFLMEGNSTNGYRVFSTGQVPAGNMIFGNWSDVIMAMWSGLDVTVDTSTMSASGGTRIVCFQDLDIALRHPESMANGTA